MDLQKDEDKKIVCISMNIARTENITKGITEQNIVDAINKDRSSSS